MTYFSQALPHRRAPRFRLADIVPAVLQLDDGRRTSSDVQVISQTGGLLSLPTPLEQGSIVKLRFETYRGPVLGAAEMLFPVTSSGNRSGLLRCPRVTRAHCKPHFSPHSIGTRAFKRWNGMTPQEFRRQR